MMVVAESNEWWLALEQDDRFGGIRAWVIGNLEPRRDCLEVPRKLSGWGIMGTT